MTKRRTYTKEFKIKAVELADKIDNSAQAERDLGIPHGQIYKWRKKLNEEGEGYTDNVKRWHHSPQRHQWMALSLLEAESGMRRLTGYRDLPKLKKALKETTPDRE
jgi:transposase-like protein